MTRVRRALASLAGHRGVRVARRRANSASRFRREHSAASGASICDRAAARRPRSASSELRRRPCPEKPSATRRGGRTDPPRGRRGAPRVPPAASLVDFAFATRAAEDEARVRRLESRSRPRVIWSRPRFRRRALSGDARVHGGGHQRRERPFVAFLRRSRGLRRSRHGPVVHQLAAAAGRDRQAQPALALAMGASERRVAENNARRPKLDAVTSGRGGRQPGVSVEDRAKMVEFEFDPEEARVLASLREEGARDRVRSRTPSWTSRERADPRKECADRETRRAARWAQERAVRAARRRRRRRARGARRRRRADVANGAGRRRAGDHARLEGGDGERRRLLAAPAAGLAARRDPARVQRPEAADAAQERPRDHGQARLHGALGGGAAPAQGGGSAARVRRAWRAQRRGQAPGRDAKGALRRGRTAVRARVRGEDRGPGQGGGRAQGESQEAGGGGGAARSPRAPRREAVARDRGDAAAAAAAAGAAAREGAAGKRRIGERASAGARARPPRLRGWDDDDAAEAAAETAEADDDGLERLEEEDVFFGGGGGLGGRLGGR